MDSDTVVPSRRSGVVDGPQPSAVALKAALIELLEDPDVVKVIGKRFPQHVHLLGTCQRQPARFKDAVALHDRDVLAQKEREAAAKAAAQQ